MHTVNLADRLESAYRHWSHSAGCVWDLGTAVLTSVSWASGKQAGQFRGSPGLSPHHLFPSVLQQWRSACSFRFVSCKEILTLQWTLLTGFLQKF